MLPVSPTQDLKLSYAPDPVTGRVVVDLVLSPSGDLQLVAGLDRLEQDVRRWLQLALGSYPFDVTWGNPLWNELGRPRPQNIAETLVALLSVAQDAFLATQNSAAAQGYLTTDEQIDRFEDVQVQLYDDDPSRCDITFTIVARSGNNRPAEIWVPLGPLPPLTPTTLTQPPSLSISRSLLFEGQSALLTVSYGGTGTLVLSTTLGILATTFLVGTGAPTTYPPITFTAPPTLVANGTALITATDGTNEASVVVALHVAPILSLAFDTPSVVQGDTCHLLVTYDGASVISLVTSSGTLASSILAGTGSLRTVGIAYTAPSLATTVGEGSSLLLGPSFSTSQALSTLQTAVGMFLTGTGFWPSLALTVEAIASADAEVVQGLLYVRAS